jgi:uncharacterized protein HemY
VAQKDPQLSERRLCEQVTEEYARQIEQLLSEVVKRGAENPRVKNQLAWLYGTCPTPRFQDPERAVRLAMEAVTACPARAAFWNTLGVAHYRTRRWDLAAAELKKSIELKKGVGDSCDYFFLAMAQWQSGEKPQALISYNCAVVLMKKHDRYNLELDRFRAEAKDLLGVAGEPDTIAQRQANAN